MVDAVKMLQAIAAQADPGPVLPAAAAGAVGPAAAPDLNLAEPVTLEQVKAHLRVTQPDDDTYISGLITAARAMAEGRLNRTLVQRRRVARFSGWNDALVLLKPPVLSVDNIGYLDETGGEMMLPADRFYLPPMSEDELPRVELRASDDPFPVLYRQRNPITVYYTAGYPVGQVPATIVQWILLAIGTMYANRESVVNGATSVPLADDFMRWLLQPHMVYE